MDPLVLSALEEAERQARERRQAAEAEADRLVHAALDRAREIEEEAESRSRAAVAGMRSAALEAARAEADALGRRRARPAAESEDPRARERFARAVDLVVTAVLGEPPC